MADEQTNATSTLTDLVLNGIPFSMDGTLNKSRLAGEVSERYQHLRPTTPDAWATGIKARIRYWTNNSADGPSSVSAFPWKQMNDVDSPMPTGEMTPERVAQWVLHTSVLFETMKVQDGTPLPYTGPQTPCPLWDRYRYDPMTEQLYHADRRWIWTKAADPRLVLGAPIGEILDYMIVILDACKPDVGDLIHKDKRTLSEEEKFQLRTDPRFVRYRELASFRKEFVRYCSGASKNSLINAVLANATLHTSTEVFNGVQHVQAFRNTTVAVSGESNVFEPGTTPSANPEAMMQPGLNVDWVADIMHDDGTFIDGNIVSEVARQFRQDPNAVSSYWLEILTTIESKCPTFMSFEKNQKDWGPEGVECFRRIMGATIFRQPQKMIYCYIGESNAGKDTALGFFDYMMAPGAVATLGVTSFSPRSMMEEERIFAPLQGASVAKLGSEVSDRIVLRSDLSKSVANGGMQSMTASAKYERASKFYFKGGFFMQGNSVPQFTGDEGGGLRNRVIAVPFLTPLPKEGHDSEYYEKKYLAEAKWYAFLCFFYLQRWIGEGGGREGLNVPPTWEKYTEDVMELSNTWHSIEDLIRPAKNDGTDTVVQSAVLSMALRELSMKVGAPQRSSNQWARAITKLAGPPVVMKDDQGKAYKARQFQFEENDSITRTMFDNAINMAMHNADNNRG